MIQTEKAEKEITVPNTLLIIVTCLCSTEVLNLTEGKLNEDGILSLVDK